MCIRDRILGLYNPWGATRGDVDNTGSVLDPECAQRDTVEASSGVQSARVLHAWPEGSSARLENGAVACEVGPGGTLILEVRLKA